MARIFIMINKKLLSRKIKSRKIEKFLSKNGYSNLFIDRILKEEYISISNIELHKLVVALGVSIESLAKKDLKIQDEDTEKNISNMGV